MLKTLKCHKISILVVSIPVLAASEENRVYDANGNLLSGDGYYREYNELNQLVRVRGGNTSDSPTLEEYIWHPIEERILVKDIFFNSILNYSIYYVNKNYIHIENSSGNYTEKYIYQDNTLWYVKFFTSKILFTVIEIFIISKILR